jgi:RNA-directed DNA polymerase
VVLHRSLQDKTYHHGDYREFIINDSKKRLIKAAPFKDRVVHHALCNVIEPILERGFIYDSYACRNGKGTHAAVLRLEHFVRSLRGNGLRSDKGASPIYCLKCDISKYFDSVDHGVLLGILRRTIEDEDILWLLQEIIESNPQGIPIGNLTSQLFANTYLGELDNFVKRELHERYYLRYMDDFLILDTDKRHLRDVKAAIRVFLRDQLKLTMHPRKAEIFPIDRGIDFLGYVLRDGARFLRKSTVRRFSKKRKRYAALVERGKMDERFFESANASWRGYAAFAKSYRLIEKLGWHKRKTISEQHSPS